MILRTPNFERVCIMTLTRLFMHRLNFIFFVVCLLSGSLWSIDAREIQEKTAFNCTKCARGNYQTPYNLRRHFLEHHAGEELPDICKLKRSSKHASNFLDAAKDPENKNLPPNKICSKRRNGPNQASVVSPTMTTSGQRYFCPVNNCGRSYTRSDHIREHIRDKHHDFYSAHNLAHSSFTTSDESELDLSDDEGALGILARVMEMKNLPSPIPVSSDPAQEESKGRTKSLDNYMVDILTKSQSSRTATGY